MSSCCRFLGTEDENDRRTEVINREEVLEEEDIESGGDVARAGFVDDGGESRWEAVGMVSLVS